MLSRQKDRNLILYTHIFFSRKLKFGWNLSVKVTSLVIYSLNISCNIVLDLNTLLTGSLYNWFIARKTKVTKQTMKFDFFLMKFEFIV